MDPVNGGYGEESTHPKGVRDRRGSGSLFNNLRLFSLGI